MNTTSRFLLHYSRIIRGGLQYGVIIKSHTCTTFLDGAEYGVLVIIKSLYYSTTILDGAQYGVIIKSL